MKKVLTVSIQGAVIQMDEDASSLLKSYLEALDAYFRHRTGGREIIQDIEGRIIELFREKKNDKTLVVNIDDVRIVIDILGTPEAIADYDGDNDTEAAEGENPNNISGFVKKSKPVKRLYRDPYNKAIAGVCSGLSVYFKVDVVLIRLIFLLGLVCYLTPVIIYIILWMATPKAITAAQRLEMCGKPVNIDNLEKVIRNTYTDNDLSEEKNINSNIRGFGRFVSGFFSVLIGIISKIFGIFIFLFVITVFLGGISFLFFHPVFFSSMVGYSDMDAYSVTSLFSMFASKGMQLWMYICIIIMVLLPLAVLFLLSLRLLFNIRLRYSLIIMWSLIVWVIAIICIAIGGMLITKNYAVDDKISENIELSNSDTINITTNVNKFLLVNPFSNRQELPLIDDTDTNALYVRPRMSFRTNNDITSYISVTRTSQASSRREAYEYASQIPYKVTISGSQILVPGTFKVGTAPRWIGQGVNIAFYVNNKTVVAINGETLYWLEPWGVDYDNWDVKQNKNKLYYFRMYEGRLKPIHKIAEREQQVVKEAEARTKALDAEKEEDKIKTETEEQAETEEVKDVEKEDTDTVE